MGLAYHALSTVCLALFDFALSISGFRGYSWIYFNNGQATPISLSL
jgi:hypothetical protein